MNISEVINDIKLTNGLNSIALPFAGKPVENVIREILQVSIRTFSRYKPLMKEGYELRQNLRSPDPVSKSLGIYILPDFLTTSPVQDAYAFMTQSQVNMAEEVVVSNAFTVGSPFVGFGSYMPQDILNANMTGAAINKFAGITSRTPSSRWLGSNKIQLFDFLDGAWVHFQVKCNHDANGETIEESCVEAFTKLGVLDVQRTLYNTLKNMNNVGSAFKEIQLKIDDWSGAEAARNELVEEWSQTFHYDDLDLVQFF